MIAYDIYLSLTYLLNKTTTRSIHVASNDFILFFFLTKTYSTEYMYHIFIHSSVDGHLGCFPVLAIVHSAAMNIAVHVSFQIIFLEFLK